jgi:hypothetical protein
VDAPVAKRAEAQSPLLPFDLDLTSDCGRYLLESRRFILKMTQFRPAAKGGNELRMALTELNRPVSPATEEDRNVLKMASRSELKFSDAQQL